LCEQSHTAAQNCAGGIMIPSQDQSTPYDFVGSPGGALLVAARAIHLKQWAFWRFWCKLWLR